MAINEWIDAIQSTPQPSPPLPHNIRIMIEEPIPNILV